MEKSKKRTWFRFIASVTSSRKRRELWGNLTEVIFALTLVLAGTFLLAWTVAVQVRAEQWLVQLGVDSMIPGTSLSPMALTLRTIIGAVLVVIGFFQMMPMVLASTASEERRGSVFRLAVDLAESEGGIPNQSYPSVGKIPGVRRRNSGRFIIPLSRKPKFRLIFWVLIAVLFSIGAAVSGTVAWSAWQLADFWRFVLVLTIGLGMVALGVIGAIQAGKRVLIQTRFGWSLLELEDYPLRIGSTNHLYLKQTGDVVLDRFVLMLECWEEATFREGTDVCTDRRRVYKQDLIQEENVKLTTSPNSFDVSFQVPDQLMHSFYAPNNSVSWNFTLQAKKKRLDPLVRQFPVIMLPAGKPAK